MLATAVVLLLTYAVMVLVALPLYAALGADEALRTGPWIALGLAGLGVGVGTGLVLAVGVIVLWRRRTTVSGVLRHACSVATALRF